MLEQNLVTLRKLKGMSQEQVAEVAGVSRQAYAKWENGETTPDIKSCMALANLFDVSLDDLVNHSESETGFVTPPKGKYLFGVVSVGEKGQIVIPKKGRDTFDIKAGDKLIVLGDETQGIALMKVDRMLDFMKAVGNACKEQTEE